MDAPRAAIAEGGMFRSLRHRNARLFFLGLLVSNIGSWLQLTATSMLLYRLTGRAGELGVNAALQFLPMLLLGAWSGGLADRVDRRRLMIGTQAALAAQALALALLTLSGLASIGLVYGLSLLLGIVSAIDNPARRGLVTELVAPEDIPNAVSLNTAVMTGSRIVGPALAAWLANPLGIGWLFMANAVSFAAIIGAAWAIDPRTLNAPPSARRGGQPVRDALRFVAGHERLGPLLLVFAIVSTFAFNYNVSLPALANSRFGTEASFGWLLSVTGVGSLTGALLTARRRDVSMRWFLGCIVTLGLSAVAMALAPSLAAAMVCALPLGAGGAGFVSSANVILQTEGPPDMRGRLLALTAVAFLGSTPVGGPITGWVADSISVGWSLAYGGLISLAAAAWLAWRLRRAEGGI